MKFLLGLICFFLLFNVYSQTPAITPTPTPNPENLPPPRQFLYRADFRDPHDIFHNGFTPHGDNRSLVRHVLGVTPYGQGSGLISATPDREAAAGIAYANNVGRDRFGHDEGPLNIFIYQIRATPNWHSVRPTFYGWGEFYISRDNITNGQRAQVLMRMENEAEVEEWVTSDPVPPQTIWRAWRVTYGYGSEPRIEPDWSDPYRTNSRYIDGQTESSTEILDDPTVITSPTVLWMTLTVARMAASLSACCCGINNNPPQKSLLPRLDQKQTGFDNMCNQETFYSFPKNFKGFNIIFGDEISYFGMNFGASDKQWVDFNGDGKQDHCALGYSREGKYAVLCAIQGSDAEFKMVTLFLNDYGWNGDRYWIDANGDGKTDFCRVINYNTRLRCSYSNGTKFYDHFNSGYINIGYWRSPADINGDGAIDFCRLLDEGHEQIFRCLLSKQGTTLGFGDDIIYRDVGPHGIKNPDFGDNLPNNRIWTDVNGDGKDDFCRMISSYRILRCNIMKQADQDKWVRVETVLLNRPGWIEQRWWVDYGNDKRHQFCRKMLSPYGKQIVCSRLKDDDSGFDDTLRYDLGEAFGPGEIKWADLTGTGYKDICILLPDSKKIACQLYSPEDKKWKDEYRSKAGTNLGLGNFDSGDTTIITNADKTNYFCRNTGQGTMTCLQIKEDIKACPSRRTRDLHIKP